MINLVKEWMKKPRKESTKMVVDHYFDQANSWADDYYLVILGSRNRYRVAFILMLLLCIFLVVCICFLVPSQHLEPFLVHHYESGALSVERIDADDIPLSEAQTESEIIRYVTHREAYDAHAFQKQFSLVYLLSSEQVASQYQQEQDSTNPSSFVELLGNKYERKIHVESVIFLDSKQLTNGHHVHQNLAEVNFTVTTMNRQTHQTETEPFVATISWNYGRIPSDPEKRWQNWSGFEVTSYQVSQRSI